MTTITDITVEDYKLHRNDIIERGRRVFLNGAHGHLEVTGLREFTDGPWVLCGKANGGFGLSFCVSWNSKLQVEDQR